MSLIGNLFHSSIGRKFMMAISGLVLIGFVVGHLIGNLQIFSHPDQINGYAGFLHGLGPMLWVARIGLLLAAGIHIWAGISLTLENRRARGPESYQAKHTIQATVASRTMHWSGLVVLAFILYHLAAFTLGGVETETFKANLPLYTMTSDYHMAGFPVISAGTEVLDVHSMMIHSFQRPLVSIFYILAVGLLSYHLLHGADSLFQTFGWRGHRWARGLRTVVIVFCLLYFIGNAAIPGSILAGRVELRPEVSALAAGSSR